MFRIIRLASVILAVAALTGRVSPVLAAEEGIMSGQLVNKTANGSPIGEVEVTLITYLNGEAITAQEKATTDSSGKFEFKQLSTANGTSYAVSAIFQNAPYTSDPISLTPASPLQTVELDVYDSTTSDENIVASNGHMVVYVEQGDLEVLEIWRFSNTGDKTFIGTQGTAFSTLRFSLPAGAISLSPGPGSAITTDGINAVSNVPVPPGVTDIHFSYFIPYQGTSMTMLRNTDYPIANFGLLVQDAGVKVASTILSEGSPQIMNETNYLYFSADNLARGINIDASFSGVVKPSAASSRTFFPLPWLLAGMSTLGLLIMFAYLQMKNKRIPASQLDNSVALSEEDELLMEIARLDDAYEAGTIKESYYRAQREWVKARLARFYNLTLGNKSPAE